MRKKTLRKLLATSIAALGFAVCGSGAPLIEFDFTGSQPGAAANRPWTTTSYLAGGVSLVSGVDYTTNSVGHALRSHYDASFDYGDDWFGFVQGKGQTIGAPAGETGTDLAWALTNNAYVAFTIQAADGSALDLRGGTVTADVVHFDGHGCRSVAVYTTIEGFAQDKAIAISPETPKWLPNWPDPVSETAVGEFPSTDAYTGISDPVEIRLYFYGTTWDWKGGATDNISIGGKIEAANTLSLSLEADQPVVTVSNMRLGSSNTIERTDALTDSAVWQTMYSFVATSSSTNWTDPVSMASAAYRSQYFILPPETFFSDDFESGAAGWTEGGTGTTWDRGTPTSGPNAANSGVNAYATNLGGDYINGTDRYLRSPVIDLTGVADAVIRWYEAYDLEPAYDYGHLDILDTNLVVLADNVYEANGYGALTWAQSEVAVPPAALGQPIILEFRLEADAFDPVGLGWYIDDVSVEEP
jgi:hypothetical protein